MISWNSPLFSTELAREVRQIYTMQVQSGRDVQTATATLMKLYDSKVKSKQSESIFWMSLAATQLEYHQLLPEVRNRAVAWINQILSAPTEKLSKLSEDDICACLRDICALKCWIFSEKVEITAEQS